MRRNTSPKIKLQLFGAFHAENETGSILLPARKAQALLAYLILYSGEHAREKLAALFWGDSSDAQARDSLRTALKNLRKIFGDALLVADRETVALNPAFPVWMDVREFQTSAVSNPSAAVELYRGDLLADLYDDWLVGERERFRELYLAALLRLASEAQTRGDYGQAIEWAKKVLAHDAMNEHAHRELMNCFAAMGNRSAALKQYEECRRILRAELDIDPSPETNALYQEIKAGASVPSTNSLRHTNVSVPLTSFVGRQLELEHIKQILMQQRLVTLTGAGGSGKTRLAIQVALELVDSYPEGVWWVDLMSLNDAALVPQAAANALNIRQGSGRPMSETLARHLQDKQLLLIFDNCEHLIAACAQLAEELLQAAPALKILATSREPLGIFGENVYHVPTLSLPNTLHSPLHQVLEHEATRLFVERALAVKSDFALEPNAAAIVQICQRLDGIPLAIELAAARVKILSAQEIGAHLNDRFEFLTTGSRTALPRHQTLRATIDWSYNLLTETERILFRRLSVFAGGLH